MKILFKFPTRKRPNIFFNTLDLYYRLLSHKHDFQFNITMDYDDDTMNNSRIWERLDQYKNLKYCYGFSKNKIEAVNANVDNEDFSILVLLSDDMIPIVHGYDDIICNDMMQYFPDLDGSLFYNDGRVGNAICTLSIMSYKLYHRFGYIYHPDYISLWCDNEYTDVAQSWGKMVYIDKIIIKHGWENITKHDPLFKHNQNFYERDKVVYYTRKAKGFPKESIGNITVHMPRSKRP